MAAFCICSAIALSSSSLADTVYLKPEEALKKAFLESDRVILEKNVLDADQRKTLRTKLGSSVEREKWNFYVAMSGDKKDGYALIDHEVGRMEPITFMTVLTPEGRVKCVEILVYRESHGSEVAQGSFRRQFEGKQITDPIRVGKDIKNISGATLSARAISIGVRRALVLWQVFYGENP